MESRAPSIYGGEQIFTSEYVRSRTPSPPGSRADTETAAEREPDRGLPITPAVEGCSSTPVDASPVPPIPTADLQSVFVNMETRTPSPTLSSPPPRALLTLPPSVAETERKPAAPPELVSGASRSTSGGRESSVGGPRRRTVLLMWGQNSVRYR